MPKVQLTHKRVQQATCPEGKGKVDLFDTGCKGLLLEVRASGGKTWYVRYINARGQVRQYRLGDARDLNLRQARTLADKVRAQVAMGEDPAELKAEQKKVMTFAKFIERHYLPHIRSYKRSWETDVSLLKNHLLPYWGKLPLDAIDKQRVISRIHAHRANHKPGSTNRILILVRYIFNLAIRWEIAGVDKNPSEGIPLYPENNRLERFITPDETKRLFEALEQSRSKMLKYIVPMLLLTGARRNEVLNAKWEDFDFEKRIWRIEKNKSGKPRYVPLGDAVIKLLRCVPRLEGNPWVFPNPDTGKPYVHIFYAWDVTRKRAGLPELRIHDLRHSFASFLVNGGRSLYEVQKILGHTQVRTTQRYAHLSQNTLVEAANVAADAVPLEAVMPTDIEDVPLLEVHT